MSFAEPARGEPVLQLPDGEGQRRSTNPGPAGRKPRGSCHGREHRPIRRPAARRSPDPGHGREDRPIFRKGCGGDGGPCHGGDRPSGAKGRRSRACARRLCRSARDSRPCVRLPFSRAAARSLNALRLPAVRQPVSRGFQAKRRLSRVLPADDRGLQRNQTTAADRLRAPGVVLSDDRARDVCEVPNSQRGRSEPVAETRGVAAGSLMTRPRAGPGVSPDAAFVSPSSLPGLEAPH